MRFASGDTKAHDEAATHPRQTLKNVTFVFSLISESAVQVRGQDAG